MRVLVSCHASRSVRVNHVDWGQVVDAEGFEPISLGGWLGWAGEGDLDVVHIGDHRLSLSMALAASLRMRAMRCPRGGRLLPRGDEFVMGGRCRRQRAGA